MPKDYLKIEEDENGVAKEMFGEDFAVPGTEELRSMEGWVHRHLMILKVGRVTHVVPPGFEELPDEEKEQFEKMKERDPEA